MPRHLLPKFFLGDPFIFDVDFAVLASRLSFAYFADDSLPLITLRILFKTPFLELSYVLCFANFMSYQKGSKYTGVSSSPSSKTTVTCCKRDDLLQGPILCYIERM